MAHAQDKSAKDSGILVVSQGKPAKANCWSCGAMRAAHFCQQCGKVQPPMPVDYFTFFGLPYKLNLESGQTRARVLRSEPASASRHQRHQERARTGVGPGTEFAPERRLPHSEGPDHADRIPAAAARRATGRAIQGGNRRGAPHREVEEAGCPARSAGRGLRVEHAARRDADEQEDGRERPHSRAPTGGRKETSAGQV